MRSLATFAAQHRRLGQVLVTWLVVTLSLLGIAAGVLLRQDWGLVWEDALATGLLLFAVTHLLHLWRKRKLRYGPRLYYLGALYLTAFMLAIGLGLRVGERLEGQQAQTEALASNSGITLTSQASPEVQAKARFWRGWDRFKQRFTQDMSFLSRLADSSDWWRPVLYILISVSAFFLMYLLFALSCALICSDLAVLGLLLLIGGPLLTLIGVGFGFVATFGIKEQPQRRQGFWLSLLGHVLFITLVLLAANLASTAVWATILLALLIAAGLALLITYGLRQGAAGKNS